MTEAELAEKKAKGLCFRCDGKYAPGHRCPDKALRVMIVYEGDESGGEEDEDGEGHAHLDMVEISAHSVVGFTSPQTMKLRGHIQETEVVVLIDSGATHNFVSLRLVHRLGLPVTGKKGTGIMLGNGKVDHSYGICRNMELVLLRIRITEDFYPLELGSTEVILGMKWLRQIGDMKVNWTELSMVFHHNDTLVTLPGEPGLRRAESSLQALVRSWHNMSEGYYVILTNMAAPMEPTSQAHHALDDLLAQFVDVFTLPEGLPPQRDHEHRITLKEGSGPISVRPYRYPQLQKDEIERLIGEMLEAGLIRPSPFLSPVLLVKKKDGSWRFCVDYRALNKSKVLDKFPIPVIDELLDELHGATVAIIRSEGTTLKFLRQLSGHTKGTTSLWLCPSS